MNSLLENQIKCIRSSSFRIGEFFCMFCKFRPFHVIFSGQTSMGTTWGKPHVSCLGPSGSEVYASLDLKLFLSVLFNTTEIQLLSEVRQVRL